VREEVLEAIYVVKGWIATNKNRNTVSNASSYIEEKTNELHLVH